MYSVSLREAAQILDVPMDEIRRKIKKGELRATQVVTPGGLGMGVALPGDPPDGVAQFPGNSSQNAPAVERTPGLSELFKDSPLMQPVPEAQTQRQAAGSAGNTPPAVQPAPSPNMTETNGPSMQASTQKEPLRGQAAGPAGNTPPAVRPAPSFNKAEAKGLSIEAAAQEQVTPQGLSGGNSGGSSFKVESVGNLMNSLRGQVEAQLAVRQREIQELRDLLQHLQTLAPTSEASSLLPQIESLRIETPVVPLANQAPVAQGMDITGAQQEKPRTPWWKFRLR